MSLFRLQSEGEPIAFYARDSRHIIEFVREYHQKAMAQGHLKRPETASWVKKVPELTDIVRVEQGVIRYHVGMINFNEAEVEMNKSLFSERMRVTSDFEIASSPEAIYYFDQHRRILLQQKRGELYKLHIPGELFGGLYFIPEDVARGMMAYDLTPHLEAARRAREPINKAIASHPNLG